MIINSNILTFLKIFNKRYNIYFNFLEILFKNIFGTYIAIKSEVLHFPIIVWRYRVFQIEREIIKHIT